MGLDALLREARTLVEDEAVRTQRPRCYNLRPCEQCCSRFYWRPRVGSWRCARCDPPAVSSIAQQWTHIEFNCLDDWVYSRITQMVAEGLVASEDAARLILVAMIPHKASHVFSMDKSYEIYESNDGRKKATIETVPIVRCNDR